MSSAEKHHMSAQAVDTHKAAIRAMDMSFGIYLTFLALSSLIGTLRGDIPVASTAWILVFIAFNLVFSQASMRLGLIKLEYGRFIVNAFLCPWMVVAIKGPMAPFWAAHFVINLGFMVFATFIVPNQILARFSLVFWPVNLLAAMFVATDAPNLYDWIMDIGVLAMTAIFIKILINLLKRSLAQETLRAGELQAEIDRRIAFQHRMELAHKIDQYLAKSVANKVAITEILEMVCRHLDWKFGAFWQVDTTNQILIYSCSWASNVSTTGAFADACPKVSFATGMGLPGRVWRDGRAHWIVNLAKDDGFLRLPGATQAGLQSAFAFPLRAEGQVLGVLEFFNDRVESPDEALLADCDGIGVRIGQLVHHAKLEDEIAEQRIRLVNSTRLSALGEMAGGMAHEINTPLAVIKMRAHQLTRLFAQPEINVESAKRITETIEVTVDRISKIIQGLRSFSRNAEGDPMTGELISTIVRDTINLCEQKFSNRGIDLRLHDMPEIRLRCRPAQISQVFINILTNAIDAISELSEKWIDVSLTDEDGFVAIHVTDSGAGISPEIEAKIFQPFFTTKAVGVGTGLGLSISKGIVDDHGGSLTIDRHSKHTSFVIRLPKWRDAVRDVA